MKRVFIVSILITLAACKPETEETIGTSYDLSAGIEGAWEIHTVKVIDRTLPVPETRDITDFFTTQNAILGITFSISDQTYTVQNSETPSNPFGIMGRYELDDPDYPSALLMYSSTMDTVNLSLDNMVRGIDPFMGYTISKTACGGVYAAYNYTFKRL